MTSIERFKAIFGGAAQTSQKAFRILRSEGATGLAQRTSRVAYRRFGAAALDLPLLDEAVADSRSLKLSVPSGRPARGQSLRVGWVTTPPAAGSGGHTTLFRLVESVEQAGHECTLFLYDRYGGDIGQHSSVIRDWWPNVRANVCDARSGIVGVDASVASSWGSAHVLATYGTAPMRRLYFIQDFEPYFYARGSEYALAEDSYRFGFRCVALGEMVAELLRSEIGIDPDVTQFGVDTDVYRVLDDRPRTGVVVYLRPGVPRRGYWLARLALERFHAMHPQVDIHTYGERVRDLGVPAIQHGIVSPADLNDLYNSCRAGLALSFTNISLVPEELLAAGVRPVVNDSVLARAVLANPNVVWASPSPVALANGLSDAVTGPRGEEMNMVESVGNASWEHAQRDIVRIIEDEVFGPSIG